MTDTTPADDLPPLRKFFPRYMIDTDAARAAIEAYRKAAIAAHDAKRPRVRIWRHGEGSAWHSIDANPALFPSIEFAWAYIEREGA